MEGAAWRGEAGVREAARGGEEGLWGKDGRVQTGASWAEGENTEEAEGDEEHNEEGVFWGGGGGFEWGGIGKYIWEWIWLTCLCVYKRGWYWILNGMKANKMGVVK